MEQLEKLQNTELLPDLFVLLHDLQRGEILAKDFENHAGSIRLKLAQMRTQLQEIEGISKSEQDRESQIQRLEEGNRKMANFLEQLQYRYKDELMQNLRVKQENDTSTVTLESGPSVVEEAQDIEVDN